MTKVPKYNRLTDHELHMYHKAATARVMSVVHNTRVGCCIYDGTNYYLGCNVMHPLHKDLHAEQVAIGNMIVNGGKHIREVMVVSDWRFTPCGGCVDWLMEYGGPNVRVGSAYPSDPDSVEWHYVRELMPKYPKKEVRR